MKKFTDATTDESLELVRMNESREDSISTISGGIHKLVKEGHSIEEVKQMLDGLLDQYTNFQAI